MARRYRPRKLFKFWLYRDLAEDIRLIEYINYLLSTSQFVTMVRNGLRLMWTLGEGDTSVLNELFPGIVASLKASAAPPLPDTSSLERKIDQLQQAFMSGGAGSPNGLSMLPATTGGTIGGGITGNLRTGKQIAAPQIAMPTFDDDDDQDTVIIKKRDVDPDAFSKSLLESWLAFQSTPVEVDPNAPALVLRPMNKRTRSEADDDVVVVKRAVQ